MWMVIIIFSFVQLYFIILSVTLYIEEENCEYPANTVFWNVFLWNLTRTIQYLVWVYPLIYLFWPPPLTKSLRRTCGCCKKKVPAHLRNMQSAGPKSGSESDAPRYDDKSSDGS